MLGHPDSLSKIGRRVLLGAALLLALAGCTRGISSTPGDAPNLEKWVAEVKARPAPPLEPLPVMQQFETFEYAAYSLRDPFSTALRIPTRARVRDRIARAASRRSSSSRSTVWIWWARWATARESWRW
jgi:Tfp pilus assembly protein PilP